MSIGHLPHHADVVSVCFSFMMWISTLVSCWWILSSFKTLSYLHLFLIKKGKETPRALTTGKKKGGGLAGRVRKEKKRKGKRKGRKEKGACFDLLKSNGQRTWCGKRERIKKNIESLKVVLVFLSNVDSVKWPCFYKETGAFVMLGRNGKWLQSEAHYPSVLTSSFHSPYSLLYCNGSFFQQIFIKALSGTVHY